MGYNAVIVCHIHKQCVYSMRGEESLDIQQLFRTDHRDCMKLDQVMLYADCDIDHQQFEEFWSYEQRPAAVGLTDRRTTRNNPRHRVSVVKENGQIGLET